MPEPARRERLTQQVFSAMTVEERDMLKRAAESEGRSISNFIRVYVLEASRRVLTSHGIRPSEYKSNGSRAIN